MMSLALAALFFARLVASAPAPLVARAPASVVFNSPESILATCSAPVTLSWSVRPSTDDDDDTPASEVRVSRVVVASTQSDFTRTLVADPDSRTFVWEQVNVPPGEYVITGLSGDDDVQVRPSTPFTVRAGQSTDCVDSLATFSSSTSETASTTPVESITVPSVSVFEVIRTTQSLDTQTISSASPNTATGSSSGANPGMIVAIVVVVIVILSLGLGWYCWRRLNRARQLVDIEYVYPPGLETKPKVSSDEAVRRSSDETVIEIYARAPTPVGMLSRTTTKMLAEDLDPKQTQKMLRQL